MANKRVNIPEAVYLYDDPDAAGLDVDYLAHWLADRLPDVPIHVRSDFLTYHLGELGDLVRIQATEQLERELPTAEVTDLVPPADRRHLPVEEPASRGWDVVYEGMTLQRILASLIPVTESGLGAIHLVCTVHYLGYWPETGSLFRLQPLVPGRPNLLSISSLVEGLELPRQYHFLRQQMALLGMAEGLDDLTEQFGDQALGYGDQRLNEVLKGYMLQAVFHQATGELGCSSRRCRLNNVSSHEQALKIHLQGQPGLCARHAALLKSWGGVPE